MKKLGRPTDYTDDLADQICEKVALGSNLNRICAEKTGPARSAVYKWLSQHAYFSDKYARAREDRADWRSDKLDDICAKVEAGKLDPQAARVIVDTYKWQAGKEKPKVYADRVAHDHKHSGDLSVKSDDELESRIARLLGKAGAAGAIGGTGAQGGDQEG